MSQNVEMVSNFQRKIFALKVRRNGLQPSIFVRSFSAITSIYTWLTHPLLDPQKSGRVLMDHLMKLVTTALEWSYGEEQKDVSAKHLETAAEQLTLRRDVIYVVDAIGKIEGSPIGGQSSEAADANPK